MGRTSVVASCDFMKFMLEKEEIKESSLSKGIKESSVFNALIGSGAIVKEKRGRGHVYIVKNKSVVDTYFLHNCPDYDIIKEECSRRDNIRKYRNSKARNRKSNHPAFIRSNVEYTINGQTITSGSPHPIGYFIDSLECKKICFIENIDNFKDDSLLLESGWTLLYPIGRIGTPLVEKITASRCRHFGDLDYVGLDEYRRIKESLPDAELHVPENYFQDTLKYGLPVGEGQKASACLLELAEKDSKVKEVVDFLQREHLVLEQEGYDGD